MKNIYLASIIGILLVGAVIATSAIIRRPDIKEDITEKQKQIMKEKYNAEGYKIGTCWWNDECYFCDMEMGTWKEKRVKITCNFEEDKKIWEINETTGESYVIGEYTMQELLEKRITNIVEKLTKEKEMKLDKENIIKEKKWKKKEKI